MNSRTKALFEIHIAVFLFGLAGLFGKFLELHSIVIVFGRVLFATLALIPLLAFNRQSIRLRSTKDYLSFLLLGVILAIHWGTFFYSIQISTVAIGLITFSTFPVFVVFLEPLFFREKLHMRDVLIAMITFAGIVLVIPSYDINNNLTQGALWGLVSGVTFAVLSILNRKYVADYSSVVIAFYQDAIAAIVLLPFVVYLAPIFTAEHIALLILLGVVFTAIAHSLFIKGMKLVQAKTASIIASLESVYGIVFAGLLLSEIPSVRTVAGGIIVLGAALYASIKKQKNQTNDFI